MALGVTDAGMKPFNPRESISCTWRDLVGYVWRDRRKLNRSGITASVVPAADPDRAGYGLSDGRGSSAGAAVVNTCLSAQDAGQGVQNSARF